MKRAYGKNQAERMLPLLTSIARELDDRSTAIRAEELRLRRLEAEGGDEIALANRVASLAEHKRELRHALEELEQLGCEAEAGLHSVIYGPGADGQVESGYQLDARGELLSNAALEAA